nr:glycosyltransferase family 39 protein [Ancylobacter radicis]
MSLARLWRSVALTRAASLLAFAGIAVFILLTFRDYGISNDEPVQHTYGQLLLNWYASGFSDESAFHYINLYLYGGLFDLIAAGFQPYVPLPLYEWRHLLSAGFGFVGLIGVWRLGTLLGGEKAGILAVLMLAVTGMYGGAMFTHTKDVPFAAAMLWSLYCVAALAARLPERPSWRLVVGLGLSVGCALGLRVGGVFAVFYLLVTLAAGTLLLRDLWLPVRLLPRLMVAGLIALAVMAAAWPWSVLPPSNFLKAMGAFNNFAFDLKTLINGEALPIDRLPPTYMSEYLLIKLPEITLLGLVAALAMVGLSLVRLLRELRRDGVASLLAHHPRRLLALLPVLLAVAVPVVFTLLDNPPLYNGIRHFLFVLPPVTVLAALGLMAAGRALMAVSPLPATAFAGIAVAVFGINADTFARLHPYQYVAYNQLVGGTAGAWGRFEGDYWGASLREASLTLLHGLQQEAALAPGRAPLHYKVAVCAEDVQVSTHLGPEFEMVEDWDDADFVLSARNVGCDNVPGLTYATVSRMGIPMASVFDVRGQHPPIELPVQIPDEDGWGLDFNAPAVSLQEATGPLVAKARP